MSWKSETRRIILTFALDWSWQQVKMFFVDHTRQDALKATPLRKVLTAASALAPASSPRVVRERHRGEGSERKTEVSLR